MRLRWLPFAAALAGAVALVGASAGLRGKGPVPGPAFPRMGRHSFGITAAIRTTEGGSLFSRSSASTEWACGGKCLFVRGGRLGLDVACVGIYTSNTPVADGAWHRVAVSYDDQAGEVRFYVDGILDGVSALKTNEDVEGDILRIGSAAYNITGPQSFTGDVDEVAFYDRPLAPADLDGREPTEAVAWWPMDRDGSEARGRPFGGAATGLERVQGVRGGALRFSGGACIAMVRPGAALEARLKYAVPANIRLAIADMIATYGSRFPQGPRLLAEARGFERDYSEMLAGVSRDDPQAIKRAGELLAFQRRALLANPLLDFDRMLVVQRDKGGLGLVQNWESNSSLPRSGTPSEIAILERFKGAGTPSLTTLYRPDNGRFVGDVDLHWDARRMLFSMPDGQGQWQIWECATAPGSVPHMVPTIPDRDVDNYDACYLPDGAILFTSTAPMVGVPCVTGASHVSNCYRREPTGAIRRLTFEQDHDWCPTVMPDGRVLYQRWEYSDIPHFVSRILFTMNPDGTNQMAHYGTNSYWPNSMFYARPIPGDPTRFVAVVSGHHDTQRMGELVLFDTARGTHEADGAVQRFPGRGQRVKPVIADGLVGASWPKFLHPWPLSDRYHLVSAKLRGDSRFGIYLADAFDNLTLICESPNGNLMEPIPLRAQPTPPAIPNRVRPGERTATVQVTDIYAGPGLQGVPRGTVKQLRLFTYQFAYHGMGGQMNRIGLDGPWDVKRIIGTVPVSADGSAYFRVPANTPISMQPLDADGKALQLMRSWMTAMPGETISCNGCHESTGSAARRSRPAAAMRLPDSIRPWYGSTRGFSFRREVQPVLDRYCVSCHGGPGAGKPDLRDAADVRPTARDAGYNNGTHFPPSYLALRSYVRGHTMESDIHLLTPAEFSADTTRLVRMLKQGHHGVRLGREAWDRLYTWIDLNTPAHGTWHEIVGNGPVDSQRARRKDLDARYAGLDDDAEAIVPTRLWSGRDQSPPLIHRVTPPVMVSDRRLAGLSSRGPRGALAVALGNGQRMEMVRVPGRGGRPLLMGKFEVTNAQYAAFDRQHDSRLETGDFLQFSEQERGYPVNGPTQPVCRVSFNEAAAFCQWLSRRTGRRFRLPTDQEWEAACRAGARGEMWWGDPLADFSRVANLADSNLRTVDTFAPWSLPSGAIQPWRLADEAVNDGHRVSAPVGSYRANGLGLFDMQGNVAEWTLGMAGPGDLRVARGGSWYDRPQDARIGSWTAYPRWQRVFDVGFRVVCEE